MHMYESQLHEFRDLCSLYSSNEDTELFLKQCTTWELLHSYDTLLIKCGKYRWLCLHEFEQLVFGDNPYPDDLRITEEPDIKLNSLRFTLHCSETERYNYSIWNSVETELWNIALIHIQENMKPERIEYTTNVQEILNCIKEVATNHYFKPKEICDNTQNELDENEINVL